MNFLDWLRNWAICLTQGAEYKTKYERCSDNYAECISTRRDLEEQLEYANELIRQLELLVPRPTPPTIDYVVEKDAAWMQQQIDSMGLGIVRHSLNGIYPMTDQKNTLNVIAWDWTDQLPYIRANFDCEMFAMLFMVRTALIFGLRHIGWVLDYRSAHSYNLIVYPDGNKQVLEPQSDGLYVWTERPEQFYPLQGAIVAI